MSEESFDRSNRNSFASASASSASAASGCPDASHEACNARIASATTAQSADTIVSPRWNVACESPPPSRCERSRRASDEGVDREEHSRAGRAEVRALDQHRAAVEQTRGNSERGGKEHELAEMARGVRLLEEEVTERRLERRRGVSRRLRGRRTRPPGSVARFSCRATARKVMPSSVQATSRRRSRGTSPSRGRRRRSANADEQDGEVTLLHPLDSRSRKEKYAMATRAAGFPGVRSIHERTTPRSARPASEDDASGTVKRVEDATPDTRLRRRCRATNDCTSEHPRGTSVVPIHLAALAKNEVSRGRRRTPRPA